MTKKTKEDMKLYFEAFLPDAISDILESCQKFLSNKNPEESKDFLEFNKACKAALSNLEQLFKLYKESEIQDDKGLSHEALDRLYKKSHDRIGGHKTPIKKD